MTNPLEFAVGLLNFCLLLFLLKIFLVDPLKGVAREREEKARRDMEEAEAILVEARALLERYESLLAGLEEEAGEIALSATRDAEVVRETVEENARTAIRQVQERAALELSSERGAALAELRQKTAEATVRRAEDLLRQGLDAPAQRDILVNLLSKVGTSDA